MSVLLEISKKLRGQNDPTREQIQKLLDQTSASWKTQKDQNKLIYEEMTKLNDTTNKILDILKPTLDDLEARREGARRGMVAPLLPSAAAAAAAASAGAPPPPAGSGRGGFLGGLFGGAAAARFAPALLNPAVLAGLIGGGGVIAAMLAARETDPEELAEIREDAEALAATVDEFAGMDVPPPLSEESDTPETRAEIAAETERLAATVDEFAGMDVPLDPPPVIPPEVIDEVEAAAVALADAAEGLEDATSGITESIVEASPEEGRGIPTLPPSGMIAAVTLERPESPQLNIGYPDPEISTVPSFTPVDVETSGLSGSPEGERGITITPPPALGAPPPINPISTEGLTPADRPEVTGEVLLPDFSGRIEAESSFFGWNLQDMLGRTSRPEMAPFAPFTGGNLSPASPFIRMPPTVPDFSDDDIMYMILDHIQNGRFSEAASLIDNYPTAAARVGESSIEEIYRLAGRDQPSGSLRLEITPGSSEELPEINLPSAGESWPYREFRSQRIGKGASLRGLMAPMIAESGTGAAPVVINAPNNSTNSIVGSGGSEKSTGGMVTTVDNRTSYPM